MPDLRDSLRIVPTNVLDPVPIREDFADPSRPLEIDMGCGKGRFLLARARTHPDINFLGVDRLLGRMRKVDRKASRAGLANVRLLRMDAFYATRYLVPAACVSVYYLFFPDPWPKTRHQRHRLFNPEFMDALVRTLRPGGVVHAATDHLPYFAAIARIVREDPRFEIAPVFLPTEEERTDFELCFLGTKPIARCSFRKRVAPAAPEGIPLSSETGRG